MWRTRRRVARPNKNRNMSTKIGDADRVSGYVLHTHMAPTSRFAVTKLKNFDFAFAVWERATPGPAHAARGGPDRWPDRGPDARRNPTADLSARRPSTSAVAPPPPAPPTGVGSRAALW